MGFSSVVSGCFSVTSAEIQPEPAATDSSKSDGDPMFNRRWTLRDTDEKAGMGDWNCGNSEKFRGFGRREQRNDRNERKKRISAFLSRAFVSFVVP